ncbi:MAG: hypothetical protein IT244_12160 [Bacteroidia bacterium]|nr:hypothetical protein [Bacteroidia bacterium]
MIFQFYDSLNNFEWEYFQNDHGLMNYRVQNKKSRTNTKEILNLLTKDIFINPKLINKDGTGTVLGLMYNYQGDVRHIQHKVVPEFNLQKYFRRTDSLPMLLMEK